MLFSNAKEGNQMSKIKAILVTEKATVEGVENLTLTDKLSGPLEGFQAMIKEWGLTTSDQKTYTGKNPDGKTVTLTIK